MQKVVKVKFRNSSRCYYFGTGDLDIHDGMSLIVNTTQGDMLGTASGEPTEMDETRLSNPLKPVLRIATEDDLAQMEYYRSKESDALAVCRKKVEAHGLEMKLVDAEYAFNGSKLTFYFTAENRVDFRELLKDLTSTFRSRIDLRQIGDRDEAKKCGGLGFCGRAVCCSTFLSEFTPVSIKMAKTQNLSLNPLKISGICGKLMCCLRYEQDAYESMQKVMPRVGAEFVTPDGKGTVLENNVITETTKLKITLPDGTFDVRSYPFRELTPAQSGYNSCCDCGGCGGECGSAGNAGADEASDGAQAPEQDGMAQSSAHDPHSADNAHSAPDTQAAHTDKTPHNANPTGEAQQEDAPEAVDAQKKPREYKPGGKRFVPRHPRTQGASAGCDEGSSNSSRDKAAQRYPRQNRPNRRFDPSKQRKNYHDKRTQGADNGDGSQQN